MKLIIALIQKSACPNQPAENQKRALEQITEAKKRGADLVVFPEMWSNGYAPPYATAFDCPRDATKQAARESWLAQAISLEDSFVTQVQQLAAQLEIGVVLTFLKKEQTTITNSAICINQHGTIILDYAKVHTCDFSLETLIDCGQEFPVAEFNGVKIGLMICYDREFPEAARELMLGGAELIFVPNACDMNPARLNQLSTRAFENMVGIAMANYPGKGWGQSAAFSPIVFSEQGQYQDNQLLLLAEQTEEIGLVTFDIGEIRAYRKRETWGNAYRKVNAYQRLCSPEVQAPFKRKDAKKYSES
jgi:predicted amidohydrolase